MKLDSNFIRVIYYSQLKPIHTAIQYTPLDFSNTDGYGYGYGNGNGNGYGNGNGNGYGNGNGNG